MLYKCLSNSAPAILQRFGEQANLLSQLNLAHLACDAARRRFHNQRQAVDYLWLTFVEMVNRHQSFTPQQREQQALQRLSEKALVLEIVWARLELRSRQVELNSCAEREKQIVEIIDSFHP